MMFKSFRGTQWIWRFFYKNFIFFLFIKLSMSQTFRAKIHRANDSLFGYLHPSLLPTFSDPKSCPGWPRDSWKLGTHLMHQFWSFQTGWESWLYLISRTDELLGCRPESLHESLPLENKYCLTLSGPFVYIFLSDDVYFVISTLWSCDGPTQQFQGRNQQQYGKLPS